MSHPDTLAEWLYRHMGLERETPWAQLSFLEQKYWSKEAEAIEAAVLNYGAKKAMDRYAQNIGVGYSEEDAL